MPKQPAPCPICGNAVQPETRPFCSDRCRQIDLGQWLDGSYRIAGEGHDAESPTPNTGREDDA